LFINCSETNQSEEKISDGIYTPRINQSGGPNLSSLVLIIFHNEQRSNYDDNKAKSTYRQFSDGRSSSVQV